MTRLTEMDSTGFEILINTAKRLGEKKRNMVIIVKDRLVMERFRIAKFHLLFPIVETEAEAIEAINFDTKEKWDINEY